MFEKLHRKTLQRKEQKCLLKFARSAIIAKLNHTPLPTLQQQSHRLSLKRGAFVTLTKDKKLRGCIGLVYAVKPLYKAVQEAAQAAAFDDPRFPPLKENELPDIKIEISVISPLKKIKSIKDINVGKHGLLFRLGESSGLLLPQVAEKNKWSRQKFLEHVCMKAGLGEESWKNPDAEMMIFKAQVFEE